MSKSRVEAFSDGVVAILITIMVLELDVPEGVDAAALGPLAPVLSSYVLSFVFLGIYWNNHHHLFQAVERVNGPILWANLHLLFWLSLVPFVTAWMGQSAFAAWPTALYGGVLWMAAFAYYVLARTLVGHHGQDSLLAAALGTDVKGRLSLVAYSAAVPLAFVRPWLAGALYVLVAAMWLVPDRRIEEVLVR